MVKPAFEELDYSVTPMGPLSLRRRRDLARDCDVYEVKLGEDYLMSSLFTASEIALADLGLASFDGREIDVAVGGLGLGYTAEAALAHRNVRSLFVVEALSDVIDWHERGLVPLGATLTGDARCTFIHGDFFSLSAATAGGYDPLTRGRKFDAILLDIDHSPSNVLQSSHAAFYAPEGLRGVASHLRPGGVFAMWSNDPPDAGFVRDLDQVFARTSAHTVAFDNLQQDGKVACTVYVSHLDSAPDVPSSAPVPS
jgi:spermidine synthase